MAQNFKLKNGEISIKDDRFLISDDSAKKRRNKIFTSSLWIFIGIMFVLRFFKNEDQFLLWAGLIIGVGHLIVLILTLLKTDKKELLFAEIKSIKERKFFSNRFIDIKLNNNRVKRIMPDENSKDILENLEMNNTIKNNSGG